jgi:hypothetical protein
MASEKISFSLNDDEGLAALRQQATQSGFRSAALYAKQIVTSHLQDDGQDQTAGQLTELQSELAHSRDDIADLAKQLAEVRKLVQAGSQSDRASRPITAKEMSRVLYTLLQEGRPDTATKARAIVKKVFPDTVEET